MNPLGIAFISTAVASFLGPVASNIARESIPGSISSSYPVNDRNVALSKLHAPS